MPGGLDESGRTTTDRTIQQIRSNVSHGMNRHHHMYETDCVTHSIDGNTEQLLIERMINSVNMTIERRSEELISKTRHSKFTPEHVANLFGCNIGMAKDILPVRHKPASDMRYYRSVADIGWTTSTSTTHISLETGQWITLNQNLNPYGDILEAQYSPMAT